MTHLAHRPLGWLVLGAALAACSADPATQLVVVVDTDLEVPTALDEVRVAVTGPSGTTTVVTQTLEDGGELPLTLGVTPAGEALGPVAITADGLSAGSLLVSRRARTQLVRGKTLTLYLFLSADCVGRDCPEGQTCTPNGCEPVEVAPEDLPPWSGSPPLRDAGLPDGAPADAGRSDAGPTGCTSAAECDDGLGCTNDLCDDGLCVNAPDDAVCTDGSGGVCDPTDGCQYDECTPETCTAGPCQTAACTPEGRCERTNLCGTGETCCAGACVPAGCDDGNPCTDDACGAAGCERSDNTVACDDGLFCNGADTCSGGSCAAHAGSPCSGSAVCDEASNVCTGCLSDTDCSAPIAGAWSPCGGFSDTCDQTGSRSRTVTSFRCVSGTCNPSDSTEPGSCTRTTDGTTCGATSCGSYGACGSFSNTCDETGSRSRTCTDRVCSSGSCASSNRTETASCARDTDGTSCGTTSCGTWGTCGGYSDACDETGTQSRSCTVYACAGGGCGTSTTNDSQACSRATDGLRCDDLDSRTCLDTCTGGICFGEELCPPGCECDFRGLTCVSSSGGPEICAL